MPLAPTRFPGAVLVDSDSGSPTDVRSLAPAVHRTANRYAARLAQARYIETFSSSVPNSGTPPGLASYPDGINGYTYAMLVTGAAGAGSVTRQSGHPIVDAGTTAVWAAVIQHDDGTVGFYIVTGTDGVSAISISPPLRAAVTNKTLCNRHNSITGQHYTALGYRAFAQLLYNSIRRYTARDRWLAQMLGTASSGSWVLIGGAVTGGFLSDGTTLAGLLYNSNLNISDGLVTSAITTHALNLGVDASGKGAEWAVPTRGLPGWVETSIGIAKGGPATVELELDGIVVFTKTVTRDVEHLTIPFSAATTAKLRVKILSATVSTIRIGTTTWWTGAAAGGQRAIDPTATTLLLMDSWGVYYAGATATELTALMAADSGTTPTLINNSVGGTTSLWARTNFQTLVLNYAPTQVIFSFFTNDQNAVDGQTLTSWLDNLRWLVDACLANGITPIVVMPAPTGSAGQTQNHGLWASSLALGGSNDPTTGNFGALSATSVTTNEIDGGDTLGGPVGNPLLIKTYQPNSASRTGVLIKPSVAIAGNSGNQVTVQDVNGIEQFSISNSGMVRHAYYERHAALGNPGAAPAGFSYTFLRATGGGKYQLVVAFESGEYIEIATDGNGFQSKTASYTSVLGDRIINCDATAGAIVITPPASLITIKGVVLRIKKTDASANAVSFAATVEGVVNPSVAARYGMLKVYTDGTSWFNA